MKTKRIYAVQGYDILQKETSPHSGTSRRVYVPKDWEEIVIINITER